MLLAVYGQHVQTIAFGRKIFLTVLYFSPVITGDI